MQCNNIDEVGYWFQNLPRGKYDYIQVEIIQRRKDGSTEYRGDQPESRTIRKLFLKDPEELWAKAEDIRKICIANKARAYVYPPMGVTEVARWLLDKFPLWEHVSFVYDRPTKVLTFTRNTL